MRPTTTTHPTAASTTFSSQSTASRTIASHKVLRNTYALLALTLIFSALVAGISSALNLPHPGLLITLGGYFGLLFLTTKFRNSAAGLLCVFALTGFMGYTLGPMLNAYLALPNGGELVMSALAMTGLIFVGLSALVLVSKRDFSFLGSFLGAGILVAFGLGLAAYFFEWGAVSLAVSGLFVLLMCGMILYETSNILQGGETNYIMATVTLYVSIYNLFVSLLQLLGVFSADD